MGFVWVVEPNLAFPDLYDKYSRTIFQSGNRVAHQRAEEMQEWGRQNAIWEDQSGRARSELTAVVIDDEFGIGTIVVKHGPPWGLWLEIANNGKYAIITKMIDTFAPVLWRDLQRIMNLGLISK